MLRVSGGDAGRESCCCQTTESRVKYKLLLFLLLKRGQIDFSKRHTPFRSWVWFRTGLGRALQGWIVPACCTWRQEGAGTTSGIPVSRSLLPHRESRDAQALVGFQPFLPAFPPLPSNLSSQFFLPALPATPGCW